VKTEIRGEKLVGARGSERGTLSRIGSMKLNSKTLRARSQENRSRKMLNFRVLLQLVVYQSCRYSFTRMGPEMLPESALHLQAT
jgi:hypothetical protein